MRYLLAIFALGCALSVQAQTEMNVDQLAQFIRSELALKQQTDKQLAAYIKKEIKLNEKLTDKTIDDLEAQGAGPRTVDALHALRDQTASLKPPSHDATYSPATAPESPINTGPSSVKTGFKTQFPPPNSVRQQEILDEIRQYAMNYTANLPNFICLQVTRQYVDPNSTGYFHLIQTINAQLSYNEGQEHHQVISVNGKLVNIGFEDVSAKTGGAISTGEFGEMMQGIFDPKSDAQINWDHWGNWDGKKQAVFNYYIDSGHSEYRITDMSSQQQIITAYRGLVYADEYTGEIARITLEAVNIPSSFPVNEASEALTFGDSEINGKMYNTPLKADLRLRSGRQKDKNDIEFRLYRKFGTESNVVYGAIAPPPLPENDNADQPAASGTTAAAQNGTKQPPVQAATPAKSSDPWTLPAPPPPPPQ
jgi:hypothetical protein